jgi:hypothetical protein
MGATNWEIYVPYQEDISKALEAARKTTFDLGHYRKPYAEIDLLYQANFFKTTDEERDSLIKEYGLDVFREPIARMGIETFEGWLNAANHALQVETIEELTCLAVLSSDGTSSVLDINSLTNASSVSSEDILRWFHTSTPTRQQFEQCEQTYDDIDRGEARYLIVYEAETPSEILFFGYSWD